MLMSVQNLRLSRLQLKRNRYLSKRRPRLKKPSSFISSNSSNTSNNSTSSYRTTSEDTPDYNNNHINDYNNDELVCTNCVETDYYLARFCEELFCSPASAIAHLEGLIKNPEFPKGDLHTTVIPAESVPITTDTCVDCNPQDEKQPPKVVRIPTLHAQSNPYQPEPPKKPPHSAYNYEKQRREVERQLINKIYELVSDQQPPDASHHDSDSNSSNHLHQQSHNQSQSQQHRITKLHVSEMAIQRMKNIKKINYASQIERIKLKLLQSYRAFSKLDNFVCQMNSSSKEVLKVVPYLQKMKELEKSLQIKS